MHAATGNGTPLWGLVKGIVEDGKLLVKEELQLAKTETAEKVCSFGRKAAPVAIWACLAYAGLIALLAGIGLLGGFGLQQLGVQPLLAAGIGLGAAGLLTVALAALFIRESLKAFSKEPLKPEKTIETLEALKELPPGAKPAATKPEPEDTRTSLEIKRSVMDTECRLANTLDELERRLTLAGIRDQAMKDIQTHPYRWGLMALGTGFAGKLLLKRKSRPNLWKWSALALRALWPLLAVKKKDPYRWG